MRKRSVLKKILFFKKYALCYILHRLCHKICLYYIKITKLFMKHEQHFPS